MDASQVVTGRPDEDARAAEGTCMREPAITGRPQLAQFSTSVHTHIVCIIPRNRTHTADKNKLGRGTTRTRVLSRYTPGAARSSTSVHFLVIRDETPSESQPIRQCVRFGDTPPVGT